LKLHADAYVMESDKGVFSKFAELKKGQLVAVYGWNKDGTYVARRIVILNPDNYLIKRLDADAKSGVFYKHEK